MIGKVLVWPAKVIKASAATFLFPTLAQNRSQTHTDPAIQRTKSASTTMLEIPKPAAKCPIHICDDVRQTVSIRSSCLLANHRLQLRKALLPWPTMFGVEVVAQGQKKGVRNRFRGNPWKRLLTPFFCQQFDLQGKRTHIKNSAWDDDIEMGIGREHLFSPTGFLDDNWFHRSYWVYGNSFLEGCSMPSGGWFEMGRISPSGKMLCFDDTTVYGYGQFPQYSKWSTPLRYSLFSVDKKPKRHQPGATDAELRKTRPNWREYRTLRCPKVEFDFHWQSEVPLRAKAIVKTPNMLFLAGPEQVLDEEIVFQGLHLAENQRLLQKQNELINSRSGGKLLAVSARDGSAQQMIDLESQPVWDGMAAAYGKLFLCCRDGSIIALNAGKEHD